MTAQEVLKECLQIKDNGNLLKLIFFEFFDSYYFTNFYINL